jgi:uncharacterized protein YccT (UPF0319 family)
MIVFMSSPTAYAESFLTVSDNLILKQVNDKDVDVGFFSTQNKINLVKGEHILLVKYKDVFEDLDFAEERLVESDLFIIKFRIKSDQILLLTTPAIKNLTAAEKFSRMPEVTITNQKGKSLVLDLMTYDDYKLAKKVNMAVNSLVTSQASDLQTNQKNVKTTVVDKTSYDDSEVDAQAAANKEIDAVDTNINLNQAFNNKVTNNIDTLPMLKYWWKKASDQEKQGFINFIKSN